MCNFYNAVIFKMRPKFIHRRSNVSMQAYLNQGQDPILLPRCRAMRIPATPEETRGCVLDALACTVPREGRMRIFKQWHDIIIVSYAFKGGELLVIVRTRSNHAEYVPKYHILSHLLHNCLHVGPKLLPLSMTCARESVYKCVQLYANTREYLLNDGILLTHIPLPLRSVFPLSNVSLACARLFIGDLYARHGFLFKLSSPPSSFGITMPAEMAYVFMGRRSYKEHQCPHMCPCKWDLYRISAEKASADVAKIPLIVPSIIDGHAKVMFGELERHIRSAQARLFLNDLM